MSVIGQEAAVKLITEMQLSNLILGHKLTETPLYCNDFLSKEIT